MNKLHYLLCIACVILSYSHSYSQPFISSGDSFESQKTGLFSKTGPVTICSTNELNSIFLTEDSIITLSIDNYRVKAAIIARVKTDNQLERINAKLLVSPGYMISISRILMTDGTFVYHGLIMNPDYQDALVICKIGTGYCFMKTETRLLKTE